MGLVNTLNYAKAEGDLGRRDAMLDELRALAGAHCEDEAVRENLAMGVFNTLNYVEAEGDLGRRDALLHELRTLLRQHGEDAAVRERLAMGLFNTLNAAKAEGDLRATRRPVGGATGARAGAQRRRERARASCNGPLQHAQ